MTYKNDFTDYIPEATGYTIGFTLKPIKHLSCLDKITKIFRWVEMKYWIGF